VLENLLIFQDGSSISKSVAHTRTPLTCVTTEGEAMSGQAE